MKILQQAMALIVSMAFSLAASAQNVTQVINGSTPQTVVVSPGSQVSINGSTPQSTVTLDPIAPNYATTWANLQSSLNPVAGAQWYSIAAGDISGGASGATTAQSFGVMTQHLSAGGSTAVTVTGSGGNALTYLSLPCAIAPVVTGSPSSGNSTTATPAATVSGSPASVPSGSATLTLTVPAPTIGNGTMTFSNITATESSGSPYVVTAIQAYVNSAAQPTINLTSLPVSPASFTLTGLAGQTTVAIKAFDSNGSSALVYVNADYNSVITLTVPTPTVSGSTVTFSGVTATDVGATVTSLQAYVNGAATPAVNLTTAPVSPATIVLPGLSGINNIVVKAFDSNGASTQVSVSLSIGAACSTFTHFHLTTNFYYTPSPYLQALELDPDLLGTGYACEASIQFDILGTGRIRLWDGAGQTWTPPSNAGNPNGTWITTQYLQPLGSTAGWISVDLYGTFDTTNWVYTYDSLTVNGVNYFSNSPQVYHCGFSTTNYGTGWKANTQFQIDLAPVANASYTGYYDNITITYW